MILKYKAPEYKSTNVSFSVLDINGKEIKVSKDINCYAHLTYGMLSKDAVKVRTWFPKKQTGYEERIVKKWVKEMDAMGFPVTLEIDEKQYVFELDLNIYKKRLYFTSCLMLIRYLFEHKIETIPYFYFAIRSKVKDCDRIEALLLAHQYNVGGNSNHMFRTQFRQGLLTQEDWLKKLEKSTNSMFEEKGYFQIESNWRGKDLSQLPPITKDYLKEYENTKQK